jgi:hypothetical protein
MIYSGYDIIRILPVLPTSGAIPDPNLKKVRFVYLKKVIFSACHVTSKLQGIQSTVTYTYMLMVTERRRIWFEEQCLIKREDPYFKFYIRRSPKAAVIYVHTAIDVSF